MSVKFSNVFYTYSPKSPFEYQALKDINLEFEEGKFIADGESYIVPIDRLFSIFVEMLEAYDNLNRMEY